MAVYQASFLSPSNIAIDASASNVFSFVFKGSVGDKYQAYIYKVSDNSQVYTTGLITTPQLMYDGTVVTFTVPALTLTNGIDYKWSVVTYEANTANTATSFQVPFKANAAPVLGWNMALPTTQTTQKVTFTGQYSQAQNVPIEYWYIVIKDGNGQIVEQSQNNYNSLLSYSYSGFVNTASYSAQFFAVTQNGVLAQSVIYSFTMNYPTPSIVTIPSIVQDCITSIVNVIWGIVVILTASVSGAATTFIHNYNGIPGNWALSGAGSKYYATVNIPEDFTFITTIKINDYTMLTYTDLITLKNTSTNKTYVVGYDDGANRFYYNNDGIIAYSEFVDISLLQNDFIVFIRPTDVYINILGTVYTINIT